MTSATHLERLNFFNGQRLAAADLRVEQAYHMTVRRLLNRALFAPGIAAGLQVAVKPGDPRTVIVSPGVALDDQGREILLQQERGVPVVGEPSPAQGSVYGNYLVIEYAEAPVAREDPACAAPRHGPGWEAAHSASDGPARLRSEPRLGWRPTWPRPGDGQVVLVQAELSADCAVRRLDHNVRTSVVPRRAERTVAFALEAEEHLDADNPMDLSFHVRGHRPDKVALCLHAGPFSTLFYTQLGGHTHTTTVEIDDHSTNLRHEHALESEATNCTGEHFHSLRMEHGVKSRGVKEHSGDLGLNEHMMTFSGNHPHDLATVHTDDAMEVWEHDHRPKKVVAAETGAKDQAATSKQRLRYVDDLRVRVDNADITNRLLAQLRDRGGSASWGRLGDGSAGHPLVTDGTGELDLLRLGIDFAPGEHHLRLSVPASPDGRPPNGGRINLNLYVE